MLRHTRSLKMNTIYIKEERRRDKKDGFYYISLLISDLNKVSAKFSMLRNINYLNKVLKCSMFIKKKFKICKLKCNKLNSTARQNYLSQQIKNVVNVSFFIVKLFILYSFFFFKLFNFLFSLVKLQKLIANS